MECNLDKFMKYQKNLNKWVMRFAVAITVHNIVMMKQYNKDKEQLLKLIEEMK